jgi:hypothetical protein
MEYVFEERPKVTFFPLGVQSFSCEEWLFVSGAASSRLGIRSIPLSVFSYELSMMGIAQSLDHATKPFLTYLREDDTYQTLLERILLITDEADWERMTLVTRNLRSIPLPIERTPSLPVAAQPLEEEEEELGSETEAEGGEGAGAWTKRFEEKIDRWYFHLYSYPHLILIHRCLSIGTLLRGTHIR